jgi:hypothetical protein
MMHVFPAAQMNEDEERYLAMLSSILNNQQMYFSLDYDLTHSAQRIASVDRSQVPPHSGDHLWPALSRSLVLQLLHAFLIVFLMPRAALVEAS